MTSSSRSIASTPKDIPLDDLTRVRNRSAMSTSRRSTPNPENEALLPSSSTPSETESKPTGYLSKLDITPTKLDKLSLALIIVSPLSPILGAPVLLLIPSDRSRAVLTYNMVHYPPKRPLRRLVHPPPTSHVTIHHPLPGRYSPTPTSSFVRFDP